MPAFRQKALLQRFGPSPSVIVLECQYSWEVNQMSGVVAELQARKTWLTLHLSPAVELTDEQFFELCQLNSDIRLERTAEGDIVVMPPTGGETSNRNLGISG